MDVHAFPTNREACCKAGIAEDEFYELAFAEAIAINSPQFFNQLNTERDWEQARKPYYNVWPSIVPMLTRLDLDLDSALIQLPLPALCIRLPKQHNPMTFDWQDQPFEIRCMLLSEINGGRGLSILIDVGETMDNDPLKIPIYTYRSFPRRSGLTVEQSLAGLGKGITADMGVQAPEDLIMDCVRLCCSLCLLENGKRTARPSRAGWGGWLTAADGKRAGNRNDVESGERSLGWRDAAEARAACRELARPPVVSEPRGAVDSAVGSRMVLLRSRGGALEREGQSPAAGRDHRQSERAAW